MDRSERTASSDSNRHSDRRTPGASDCSAVTRGAWISDQTSGGDDEIVDFEPGSDKLIFFNRFDEAFSNPTRSEMARGPGQFGNGFTVALDGSDLVLNFTGGDSLIVRGSFTSAPTSLDELESALGGAGSILHGVE